MPLFSLRFSVGDCNSNGDNMNRYMDGGTDRFIETDKLFRTECSMRIYKNNTRNTGKPQKSYFLVSLPLRGGGGEGPGKKEFFEALKKQKMWPLSSRGER